MFAFRFFVLFFRNTQLLHTLASLLDMATITRLIYSLHDLTIVISLEVNAFQSLEL